MPYELQNRPLYDRLPTMEIKNLSKYLKKKGHHKGTIKSESYSMNIEINTIADEPYIKLDYIYNKSKEVTAKIGITYLNSNLGNGKVFYFVCPTTYKRCRKLYLYNGKFTHREGVPNGIYFEQTKSRAWRAIENKLGTYKQKNIFAELHKPHFTKYYNGKKTRKYKGLIKKLAVLDSKSLDCKEADRVMRLGMVGVPLTKLIKY